jgi:hypothetical protein
MKTFTSFIPFTSFLLSLVLVTQQVPKPPVFRATTNITQTDVTVLDGQQAAARADHR